MYHVAICDDDKKFIAYLKRMLLLAKESKNIDLKIYEFVSGEELTMKLEGVVHYDLLILDMQLGGIDGDETARRFRKNFPNSVLAFCSGVHQPTIESFKATPFRYIDKKCTDSEFVGILKEILNEVIRVAEEPYIIGHYKRIERKIKLKHILYMKTAKRGSEIIICPKSKEVGIAEKMLISKKPEDLLPVLEKYGFALIQSGCLVNMDHIDTVVINYLILDNGVNLKITRTYQKRFKEMFARRYANKY